MASLFQLASLSTLAILMCCNADLIDDICAQSTEISPSSCTETLRSDPHSRGADLRTLGQIAIKKAKAATKNTVTVAKAVLDRNNTGAVSVCIEVCRSAIDDLKTVSKIMLEHMSDETKGDLRSRLSWVAVFVGTCDDAFEEGIDGEPAEVKEASRIAQGLVFVVRIIGTMM